MEIGEPRDASVNLSIGTGIEFCNGIARFLCHRTAFLYRPTPATVQMLKLVHTVCWFSRLWRKITAIAENHGTRPKSRSMITTTTDGLKIESSSGMRSKSRNAQISPNTVPELNTLYTRGWCLTNILNLISLFKDIWSYSTFTAAHLSAKA